MSINTLDTMIPLPGPSKYRDAILISVSLLVMNASNGVTIAKRMTVNVTRYFAK